jgi:hypothetical protein
MWDHQRALGEAPAVLAHPVDEERARADDDVRELDRCLLVHADGEHVTQILHADVERHVEDVAPRPVAEHDEERLLERCPCLA